MQVKDSEPSVAVGLCSPQSKIRTLPDVVVREAFCSCGPLQSAIQALEICDEGTEVSYSVLVHLREIIREGVTGSG